MRDIYKEVAEEAYASTPAGQVIVQTIELDMPAFDAPFYFITGAEENTEIDLENGQRVEAIACAFQMRPPGFDDGGPTPAILRLDGVSSNLLPMLRQASAGGAIQVTYRAYLSDDLRKVIDLIEGLELKRVSLSAATAEGELTFKEIATQMFPRRTYDIETYPGLWNG